MQIAGACCAAAIERTEMLTARNAPEPAFWKTGDTWHAVSSSNEIMKSPDLRKWSSAGMWMLDMPSYTGVRAMGFKVVKTPFVITINGETLMYASLYTDKNNCAIGVFKALLPEGPFGSGSVITTPEDCGVADLLSPYVTEDPETGRLWMFFGATARIHALELSPDGLSAAPGAKPIPIAGLPSENKSSSIVKARAGLSIQGSGKRFRVFTEPYVIKHGDWWYLFASRGEPGNENYALVCGRSKKICGPYVDKFGRPMLQGWSSSILQTWPGDRIYGPGNCGLITKLGEDWTIVFNCNIINPPPLPPEDEANELLNVLRPYGLFMKKISWNEDGWPVLSKKD